MNRQIGVAVVSRTPANCNSRAVFFETVDSDGNIVTPYGVDGNLYQLPPPGCPSRVTVHLKAEGEKVRCEASCPNRKRIEG